MNVRAILRWLVRAAVWLLATLALAGLLLLGYGSTRDAGRSDVARLKAELAARQQEVRKLEAAAAQLDRFKESVAELESRTLEAVEILPGDRFDRLPRELADGSGVSVSVEWGGESERDFTRVRAMTVSAEGRRDAIVRFAGQVLALPALGLSRASLEGSDGGSAWSARLEGRAFEYRDAGGGRR